MNINKKINVSQLEPGDILLLKGSDPGLSLGIKTLTHSDYTHSILYVGKEDIIHETLDGVIKENLLYKMSLNEAAVYDVFRLRNEYTLHNGMDISLVVNEAQCSCDNKEQYSFYVLAELCYDILGKETELSRSVYDAFDDVLQKMVDISNDKNHIIFKEKQHEICSQFVERCFISPHNEFRLSYSYSDSTGIKKESLLMNYLMICMDSYTSDSTYNVDPEPNYEPLAISSGKLALAVENDKKVDPVPRVGDNYKKIDDKLTTLRENENYVKTFDPGSVMTPKQLSECAQLEFIGELEMVSEKQHV